MAKLTGHQLVAKAVKAEGVKSFFGLIGGPTSPTFAAIVQEGITGIDVRHEQAAAMAAHAYGRVLGHAGVCLSASGPGTLNAATGVANAWGDACPLVALGGSTPLEQRESEAFQEIDQIALFKPITKWATQVTEARRIPELISMAFRKSMAGRQGPTYVDLPGDVLLEEVDEAHATMPTNYKTEARPWGDPTMVKKAVELLSKAERPVVVSGSGILWSRAWDELREFVEATGIPIYTTPQGRGVVPEDHPLCLLAARSTAFREADVVLAIGTRANFITGWFLPPRFGANMKLIHVNIDASEIGHNKGVEVGIVGDAKAVLQQLTEEAHGRIGKNKYEKWVDLLRAKDAANAEKAEKDLNSDQVPIHPLRLFNEVKKFLDRDAILVVDGHETLNLARQTIPTYSPGHRLNSGTYGWMGVGVPFGMGAKAAKPDKQVLVLHGDGSFGMNCMEMDTCVRHDLPIVCVINNNGGWTSAAAPKPNRPPGYYLGTHQQYDKLVEALGGYGERIENPEDIRPALERAFKSGVPACLNVITDPFVRGQTAMGRYEAV